MIVDGLLGGVIANGVRGGMIRKGLLGGIDRQTDRTSQLWFQKISFIVQNALRVSLFLTAIIKIRHSNINETVCYLFSWRYSPVWVYFHSPVTGFSLLVFEVSRSHKTTRHSR